MLMKILRLTIVIVVVKTETCPVPCTCKWKNGKQTVECLNRGLITVPEKIDGETQVLDMSGNNLQTLPKENFIKLGLINLQKVFLRNCKLGLIDDMAFRGLTNLIELDLSSNLLTSIPSRTFVDTPFLRDLTLANNPIQKIESLSFNSVHGLVKLDLSDCQIQNVAPGAFRGIEMLESLKLNGNKLAELRSKTVENLIRLHGIELHDNPWHCDCRLRGLKEWLLKNNIPYSEAPKCISGPERVRDRSFSDLNLDDFACKPEIVPTGRYVEVISGTNATITCRSNAVPPPVIKWFFNGKQLVNNTLFNSNQKIYIYEEGKQERRSTLILSNYRELEMNEFYCVAENRAGSSEVNYTIRTFLKPMGITSLGNGHIAGISAALIILILFILVVISLLLLRLRKIPVKPAQETITVKTSEEGVQERKLPTELNFCNPVQKPPRMNEVYSGSCFVSPGSNSGNNPDLIIDTKVNDNEEPVPSGEYIRNNPDSLYPSTIWDQTHSTYVISDKTPIISSNLASSTEDDLGYRNQMAGYPPDYGLPLPEPAVPVPAGAKTLRVWQKGAVPVLPPVTALKRVLRNSPDEGYQEGCGTDV